MWESAESWWWWRGLSIFVLGTVVWNMAYLFSITHRIHGAGIYANMNGVYWWYMLPYMAYMDPMGNRRKFRSQTSDNMERWKAEQGRGREKRKIRREKIRRERVRRQKIQMREKVGKSRNTVFFQWFVAPEGRKVGSLKRRVAEPAGHRSDEKLHAVVVRSTFRSQKC